MIHDRTLERIARKMRSAEPPATAEQVRLPDLLARLQAELAARGR
ncbi:hypothetical protein [Sphingomonas aracearum]|nr:hypothetical protein [Sphingomonas aracearum]